MNSLLTFRTDGLFSLKMKIWHPKKIGLPTPAVLNEVNDLDESIKKVVKAGGEVASDKVVMKSLIKVFVFVKDPEGNYLELFQNL